MSFLGPIAEDPIFLLGTILACIFVIQAAGGRVKSKPPKPSGGETYLSSHADEETRHRHDGRKDNR